MAALGDQTADGIVLGDTKQLEQIGNVVAKRSLNLGEIQKVNQLPDDMVIPQ